jgi:hypothetical protein
MLQFIIIENQDSWKNILKNFINIDCYYSFEYGNSFAKKEGGRLFAAYYEDHDTKIIYPYIKRRIPHIEEELFDIVTPYGYGGPVISGSNTNVSMMKFHELFSSYCRLHNIITETIRFHPLYQNDKICRNFWDVEYIRKTTAVDLRHSLEEIRNNYSEMTKRNIKKAKMNNLTCLIAENNKKNIRIFKDLYKETMDRNHAASYYYFDEDTFFEQVKKTDISETLLLFTKTNNEIIAGVMVLIGKEFSHYHLGASKTAYLHFRPNNLLFDFMIETCKSKGSSVLHLGGGYQENDGLFKFKASFTNDHHFEYYIGKKVHNPVRYNEVIEGLKEQYELNERYFPIYRGQIEKRKIRK